MSLHSVLVNSAALKVAGIVRGTPDPEGGKIVQDADGEPTGLLLESATALVGRHVPDLSADERLNAIATGMARLNAARHHQRYGPGRAAATAA